MDQFADSSGFNQPFQFTEPDTFRSGKQKQVVKGKPQVKQYRPSFFQKKQQEKDSSLYNPYASDLAKRSEEEDTTAVVVQEEISPYFEGLQRKSDSGAWQVIVIGIMLMLVGTSRRFYRKRFSDILQSGLIRRVAYQLVRQESLYSNTGQIMMVLFSMLGVSLLTYHAISYFELDPFLSGFPLFAAIFLGVSILQVLRMAIHAFFGALLSVRTETDEYIYNITVYNILVAFAVFPSLLLILSYPMMSQWWIWIAASLVGVIVLARLGRAVTISLSGGYPLYYIILYLCTLEILPLVVGIKLLVGKIF